MLKNKNFIFILMMLLMLSSCSEYQKVLNKGTFQEQYKMATQNYDEQKFNKAIQLFEKITPQYKGKPQMERIQFMVAQSHYNTKQYSLAAYYFDKFVKNYPKSSKVEEGAYLAAHSNFLSSPVFSLDQKDTEEAINALQNFIFKYPESKKVDEANENINILTLKLERKSFEIAKQYHHTQDYIAAIVAFDNLLADYLGTTFREEALYYKFDSAFKLAVNSINVKKEDRIAEAMKFYQRFKKNFPESSFMEETENSVEILNKEQSILLALKTESNGL